MDAGDLTPNTDDALKHLESMSTEIFDESERNLTPTSVPGILTSPGGSKYVDPNGFTGSVVPISGIPNFEPDESGSSLKLDIDGISREN